MMPISTGRYAAYTPGSRRAALAHRWSWLRHSVRLLLARPHRLAPEDTGTGYAMYREWGRWTIRPVTGWCSHRWITPPTHATRAIAHDDHDEASDWAADLLNIPH
jgi:hypothetical protein